LNTQNKNLQFTLNKEVNNQITYLDLNLTNKHGQIKMGIYRKPTTTGVTINNKSCHPREQKLAAYKTGYTGCLHYHSKKQLKTKS
jgi:hypothetical protein